MCKAICNIFIWSDEKINVGIKITANIIKTINNLLCCINKAKSPKTIVSSPFKFNESTISFKVCGIK